ncbi:CsbD family protein [Methylopila sp. M107]|uniref:CsbD family protein n=1 Tax=Methylopila sp. M107 TaxID=1101190 RepID=UPI00035F8CE1|nr:CsbD family protein [Methylopila sp. M107]
MVEKNTIKGAVKEVAGKTKAAVGKATGNKSLEARGNAEATAGKVQKGVGDATAKVKSALR